jgi:hypothetical protein
MDVVDHMRVEMRVMLAVFSGIKVPVDQVAAGLGASETRRGEEQEERPDAADATSRRAARERRRQEGPALFVYFYRLHKPLSVSHTLLRHLAADEQLCARSGELVFEQLNKMCDGLAAAMLLGLVVEYPRVRSQAEQDELDRMLFGALHRAELVLKHAAARLPIRERELLSALRSYRWDVRRAGRAQVMRERAASALCSTMLQNLGAALREELGAPP